MAEMLPIHDAAINGDLEGLTREIGNGVSPDIAFGQGGLAPLHLVITNNFITNDNGVVDLSDLDNRLACIRLLESDGRRADADFFRKVRAAGGIKKYERDHLNAIVASFAPKFSYLLPPEMVRRVVEYAFHVGDY